MQNYKILKEDEKHGGMQYRTGFNKDALPFNPSGDCAPGGMYFAREDILAFLEYGPWIRSVTLTPESQVYENPHKLGEFRKWKTDCFILGERRRITAEIIEELLSLGANVTDRIARAALAVNKSVAAECLANHATDPFLQDMLLGGTK